MKKKKFLILIASFFILLSSCNSSDPNKRFYSKKNYSLSIQNGMVLKTIYDERGKFWVVYKSLDVVDTIYISGFIGYDEKMDSLTVMNKKRNDYRLFLNNLKEKDGSRYDHKLLLMY